MKKRIKYILIFWLLCSCVYKAQINLVPNPSFEDYWSCPNSSNQIYLLKNWFNANLTPDYINACGQPGVNVPTTPWGTKYPFSGDGMVIFGCYISSTGFKNIREFVGSKLTQTLTIGTKYYASLKVSTAFKKYNNNIFTNNLGALLTTFKKDSSIQMPLNRYHLIDTNIVNDTINWRTIKGSFIADSSYQYIYLGNFKDSSYIKIDSSLAYSLGVNAICSYYYFDDICISTDSLFAYNYIFTNIHQHDVNAMNGIMYPNPAKNLLNIRYDYEMLNLIVRDCNGVLQKTINLNEGNKTVNIDLMDGVYYAEIVFNNGHTKHFKLIISNL
jgi:hypothetical protein